MEHRPGDEELPVDGLARLVEVANEAGLDALTAPHIVVATYHGITLYSGPYADSMTALMAAEAERVLAGPEESFAIAPLLAPFFPRQRSRPCMESPAPGDDTAW